MKDKKVTSLILVLVLVIGIVASGTFAYWQWITSTAQETLVNVSLTDDATIYIDFPSEEITHMYPTSDCEVNGTSSWVTDITVNNGTGVLMATNFKLKVKIEDKDGNVITNGTNEWNSNPFRYYIKYAVTEENESCQNALITGRFDNNVLTYGNVANTDPKYSQRNDWYDSKSITKDGSDGFPLVSSRIGSGVAFHAHPNTSTKHTYKVWVWLDEEYKSVTVGNDSTMDKMQDAKVTVSWSENSELEQVKQVTTPVGEAVAIYSEDDQSLRFYRDNNPTSISVGSTYNGRTVTAKYTGFETNAYESYDEIPWYELASGYSSPVLTIVFEDYIYPESTAYWFYGFFMCSFLDLTKLNTTHVTDMSYMFFQTGYEAHDQFANIPVIVRGISGWDTSNVTDMTGMFDSFASYSPYSVVDSIENWNVCNVVEYNGFHWEGKVSLPYFGHPQLCDGKITGKAYAVYSETDQSLRFYRSETPITVGSTYNGRTVSEVYTGFETATYARQQDVPWYNLDIDTVVFEDYVYPLMMSYWFSFDGDTISYIDVTKLDTSSATEITSLFYHTTVEKIIGIENWNTSNVTNMNALFGWVGGFPEEIDLSNWDTSNVTDMSYMFHIGASAKGFENWDVSNVVNMENMFCNYTIKYDVDLSRWDTSKVTNMNGMFYGASISNPIDLSGWNVCRVTEYITFTNSANIIEPNWGMSC